MQHVASAAIQGQFPLHTGGFLPLPKGEGVPSQCIDAWVIPPCTLEGSLTRERECERIAAHPQRSNGGAILPWVLEVSSIRVVGEERRAACYQCSNTEAFDCSLGFWIFFQF